MRFLAVYIRLCAVFGPGYTCLRAILCSSMLTLPGTMPQGWVTVT